MLANPLVSVIIPVYNAGEHLEECVSSVLGQTYGDLEVILVDDGSSDSSPAICDAFAGRDPRVRSFHLENGGPGAARNYGIDVAGGGFLAFVDSDDWVEPVMYEKLVSLALESGADIVGCANLTERDDGTVFNNFDDLASGMTEGRTWILDILYQSEHAWGAVWNKLFRRELVGERRFPQSSHLEDYVLTVELFSLANGVYFCSEPLYHHRLRPGSLSSKGFYEGKLKVLDVAEGIRDYLAGTGADPEVMGGADYFVWLLYAMTLWELRKSGSPSRDETLRSLKGPANRALRSYLLHTRKRKGDAKKLVMFMLGLHF